MYCYQKKKDEGRQRQQLSAQRPCMKRFQPPYWPTSQDSQHMLSPLLYHIPHFFWFVSCSLWDALPAYLCMFPKPISWKGNLFLVPAYCASGFGFNWLWVKKQALLGKWKTYIASASIPHREKPLRGPQLRCDFQQGKTAPCSSPIYRAKVRKQPW